MAAPLAQLRNVTFSVTIVNMEREPERPIRAPALADWALAHGRASLTGSEIAELLQVPEDQVRRRLHAPARRNEWVSPTRGLWIPVPPEYRTWGAPPGIEIVDAMLRHRGVDYYVGWLSAAALFGAGHQAPQVFHVAVGRQVRDRVVGRTRFVFAQRDVSRIPIIEYPTRSGTAKVSTVAATMLDVADDVDRAGGIDNVATVVLELSEHEGFDLTELTRLAPLFPAAAGRRVGRILEHLSWSGDLDLEALREAVRDAVPSPSRLDPASPDRGYLDPDWMLRVNADVTDES
ncbi:MAG TPA: type IV toxin-antitoxin system AbiEi family antitoxin [Protaetiibacter sp.]|jgi:predicted transcriptional regulator of viral defense system|nr:type IV toxin-antitoxin system AbiEi family antitoxin [Protaetiibacter sp.]